MEAISNMVESIRSVTRSAQELIDGFPFPHFGNHSARRNPIEILKRLQREAFSDLTKLRDRQEKIERLLSFYKPTQGVPFQESQTRVRGEVDALGAFILMGNVDQHHFDVVDRAGIKPGIVSRFIFSTTVRENDNLQAELVSKPKELPFNAEIAGDALSISKVSYASKLSDSICATIVPVGAQFKDLIHPTHTNLICQGKGLTDLSSSWPPLLSEAIGATVGMTLGKDSFVASAGRSFSMTENHCSEEARTFPTNFLQTSGTFGQIFYKHQSGLEFSVFGRRQTTKKLNHPSLGVPGSFLQCRGPQSAVERFVETGDHCTVPCGAFAIKVESPLDEGARISAWVEQRSWSPKNLTWAVNILSNVEDEKGWGFGVGGSFGDSRRRLQAESFARWNLSDQFCVKPGIVYGDEGGSRIVSFVIGSNWSF